MDSFNKSPTLIAMCSLLANHVTDKQSYLSCDWLYIFIVKRDSFKQRVWLQSILESEESRAVISSCPKTTTPSSC